MASALRRSGDREPSHAGRGRGKRRERVPWAAIILGLAILYPDTGHSQGIRGRVLEDTTQDPIGGVVIELSGTQLSTRTDLTGTFLLAVARPGRYTLRATHPGYALLESDTVTVGAGEPATVVLRLIRSPIPLQAVVVTTDSRARAAGFYERLRQPGSGYFITRAELDRRPGLSRATELLRALPGVEVLPVRRSRGGSPALIMMSGPLGRCVPAVYIDGMPVRQTAESSLDDFLKPSMLEGVEVYTRSVSAPAVLNAPPTCGVIAFWTRTGSAEGAEKWTLKRVLAAGGLAAVMVLLLAVAQN